MFLLHTENYLTMFYLYLTLQHPPSHTDVVWMLLVGRVWTVMTVMNAFTAIEATIYH